MTTGFPTSGAASLGIAVRAGRVVATAVGAAVLISACTGGDTTPSAGGGGGGASGGTATVERGTLDVVTTVPATVRAGATVEITAPGAGVVTGWTHRAVTFSLDSGKKRTVVLPSGVEVTAELVPRGRHVPANYPVARASVAGFAMVASLDKQTLYTLYSPPLSARAQINEGPGPFPCPLANTVPGATDGTPAEENGSGMTLVCVVPGDLNVFAGMEGIVALRTAHVEKALLLPVEAVAGTVQRGTVTVVKPDGSVEERTVGLGPTDGSRIQITSGVEEGDTVRIPAPSLLGDGAN